MLLAPRAIADLLAERAQPVLLPIWVAVVQTVSAVLPGAAVRAVLYGVDVPVLGGVGVLGPK